LPLRKNLVHEIRAEDYNRLRNAIVTIEQELGINPSGSFATVAARLASINDASVLIEAHLIDATDAHDASAISILDVADNYISVNVEDALAELASILPTSFNVIGSDNSNIPNSGIPSFVGGTGTLWVYNTNSGTDEVKRTQPVNITGIQIIDVGEENGEGSGAVLTQVTFSPWVVKWQAPGDSAGPTVNISSLSAGEIVTLESGTSTKKIRIARSSINTTLINGLTDTFDLFKFSAVSGAYSITSVGIVDSNFITSTSVNSIGTSQGQFIISGFLFPADRGTLVLQRKLRTSSEFYPIAVLDTKAEFDENLRGDGQLVYTPSLDQFDTILLLDRQPARSDYETLSPDADGNQIYENFDLSSTYSPFQVAKYIIPASNSLVVGGQLEAPTDISLSEINDTISSYRLVHYVDGITDFTGEPNSSDIFSVSDTFGSGDSGDDNVRISNVFLDDYNQRPEAATDFVLRPVIDAEVVEKTISGIHYYNSSDDLFEVELASDDSLFKKTYVRNKILKLTSDFLTFPAVDGYTDEIPLSLLRDDTSDGYTLYSDANLPDYNDVVRNRGYFLRNSTFNSSERPYADTNKFSVKSHVSATFYDPFGAGTTADAYGLLAGTGDLRILTNSYDRFRATTSEEFFTDESFRIGSTEELNFSLEKDQFTQAYGTNTDGYILQVWDSQLPLDSDANTSFSLQVGGKFGLGGSPDDSADFVMPGLIYPQDDYTDAGIRPLQFGSTDYSALSGNRFYQRLFNLGHTISGGKLRIVSTGSSLISFNDMWAGNASRFMILEIKIPGTGPSSTGWLDCGKLYQTNQYESGDGCLVSVSGNEGDFTISFTLGERNNADTGNMLAVSITYFGSQSTTAKQKILSYLQLLDF
jgi:hypothetical protein